MYRDLIRLLVDLLQDRGLARLGPGAVLGERASLEQGRRTATVRALIGCHIVSYPAAALPAEDLRQLAAGHQREEQQQQ